MFITTLKFKRTLEWFLHSSFDYLLLYASGSDKFDYEMVEEFLRYKDVIDRQTGKMVCFLHFIEKSDVHLNSNASMIQADHKVANEDMMLYHIKTETAKELTKKELYHGVGLESTFDTTEEMCSFLGIERYHLPAFILIHKKGHERYINSFTNQYSIFTITSKDDLYSFLLPIKLANDLKVDWGNAIISIKKVQSEPTNSEVKQAVKAIIKGIEKLQTKKKEDLVEHLYTIWVEINTIFNEYGIFSNLEIVRPYMIKKTLFQAGVIKDFMDNHNDLYFRYKSLFYKIEKWDKRKNNIIVNLQNDLEKKNILLLKSQNREERLCQLENSLEYIKQLYKKRIEEKLLMTDASSLVNAIISNSTVLPTILENTIKRYLEKDALIKSIIDDVKEKVKNKGFNVFISCKSEDYELGEDVYAFLKSKGYKPFIASKSLREVGNDNYSAVISEVIDICQNMIVFASELLYVETPYVKSEWNMFCNEVKAGRKKGKLLTLLQDPKQGVFLPIDLRSREVLPISSYQQNICDYLS